MKTGYYTPEINEIVFDSTAKQYAMITNGVPLKDERGRETRKMDPEKYLEAVVIRSCLGDGLFWTYVSVQGHSLSPTRVTREEWSTSISATKGRF